MRVYVCVRMSVCQGECIIVCYTQTSINSSTLTHSSRAATEQQVFFYQATVLPEVRNHSDSHCRRLRNMCRKVFLRRALQPQYYFDIQRTKHEAYSHGWQILHQVQSTEDGSERDEEAERERIECPYATVTMCVMLNV